MKSTEAEKLRSQEILTPPRLTWRGLVVAAGIYLVYSVLNALLLVQNMPFVPFLSAFASMAISTFLEGLLTLPAWWVIFRLLYSASWAKKLTAHAVMVVIFSGVWYLLYRQLFLLIWGREILQFAQIDSNRLWLIEGAVMFYIIQFSILHVINSMRELQEKERQAARLRQLARESELAALKSQINPHFLFNTLNTISAMVQQDPQQARDLVARFGDLMRYALQSSNKQLVPLSEELRFVQNYLQLEHVRFSDRLDFEIQASEKVREIQVPPMILQPLVENAVRHGVSPRESGGKIWIRIEEQPGVVLVEVGDNGAGLNGRAPAELFDSGFGLKNTNERLVRIFGESARLHIGPGNDAGTVVRFSVPVAG